MEEWHDFLTQEELNWGLDYEVKNDKKTFQRTSQNNART